MPHFPDIFVNVNGWVPFGESSYQLRGFRGTENWNFTQSDCQQQRGHLVQFDSEIEIDFSISLAHQLVSNGAYGPGPIFFGNQCK
jgi:hypothetical protein